MNVKTFKDPKLRTAHKRYYDENQVVKYIDVYRSDVEDLISPNQIWDAIKWLNEKNPYWARFDITVGMIASKVATQVLTKEEKKMIEQQGYKKEKDLLSYKTIENIEKYVAEWYEHYKSQGLIEYDMVPQRKTFVQGSYRKSYTTNTLSTRLTEQGKII